MAWKLNKGLFFKFSYQWRVWFPRTRYRRSAIAVLGIITWSFIVVPLFFYFVQEKTTPHSSLKISNAVNSDFFELKAILLNMDAVSRTAQFHIKMNPKGAYLLPNHTLSIPTTAYFETVSKVLVKGQPVDAFSFTVPFLQGSVRDYPFDQFELYFPFAFLDLDGEAVPFKANFEGVLPNLRPAFTIDDDLIGVDLSTVPPNAVVIKLTVTRTPSTFIFTFFIALIMWFLAIAHCNMTWDIVVLGRECSPPLLSLGVSMLFALPALRASQPGAPGIGCSSDVLGFYWALGMISFSSISLIFCFALRWKCEHFEVPKESSVNQGFDTQDSSSETHNLLVR